MTNLLFSFSVVPYSFPRRFPPTLHLLSQPFRLLPPAGIPYPSWVQTYHRHHRSDVKYSPEELAEARSWRKAFSIHNLPKGQASYSRSSGPGGQNVNKLETKTTTSHPLPSLCSILPTLLHPHIASSRYYVSRADALVIVSSVHRSRAQNQAENARKLYHEILAWYAEVVPREQTPEETQIWDTKWREIEKNRKVRRLDAKKKRGEKKKMRKGV